MSAIAARKAAALAAQNNAPHLPAESPIATIFTTKTTINLDEEEDQSPQPAAGPSSSTKPPTTSSTPDLPSSKRKRKDRSVPLTPTPSSTAPNTPLRSRQTSFDEIAASPRVVQNEENEDRDDGHGLEEAENRAGEENEAFISGLSIVPSGRPKKRRKIDGHDSSLFAPVSNFSPKQNSNHFLFTSDQISSALDELLKAEGVNGVHSGDSVGGVKRSKGIVIILEEGEHIVFSGTSLITPLRHSISIFSTTISPSTEISSHPVYAPLTHPLPILRPGPSTSSSTLVHPLLTHLSLLSATASNPKRTIFLLQELDSGIEGLRGDMNGPVAGLGRIWPEGRRGWGGLDGCFPIITHPGYPIYTHVTPPTWTHALNTLVPPSSASSSGLTDHGQLPGEEEEDLARPLIILIKGPKRSGKSTFAREATNRLLERYEKVAYLECDLGQSEFGGGGAVGLYVIESEIFGPSFSHPANPIKSHFVGALNPRLQPEYYLSSISSLLEHYRYEIQYPGTISPNRSVTSGGKVTEVVPLVINTQGWVKGLGADLLAQIEDMAQSTFTFEFAIPDDQGNRMEQDGQRLFNGEDYGVDPILGMGNGRTGGGGKIMQLEPVPTSPLLSKYSPAELRTLSVISYFHSDLPAFGVMSSVASHWNFDKPLAAMRPWQIDLEKAIKEIYFVGEGADGIVEEDVGLALNGSIVALLERTDGISSNGIGQIRYVQGRPLPHPDSVNCLGLALLRGISPDTRSIQLLTPLPPSTFNRISILVKGELELPLPAMMDWRTDSSAMIGKDRESNGMMGFPWVEVPFLTKIEGGEQQGIGMARRKFRRNLMRKGQGV